jgi:hypothetical protein
MPRGSRHVETGVLLEGPHGLVLRRDEGGEWQLDAPFSARRLVGRRVRVEGVRDGFDLLAVTAIEPVNGRWPPRETIVERFSGFLRGLGF